MRIYKPANLAAKSLLFRPRRPLCGSFSIVLAIDSPVAVPLPGAPTVSLPATFDWCGSRRQLAFGPSLSSFVTNLRLPQNLSEGDIYVLSVNAAARLYISVDLHGDAEAVESIAIEELDDVPNTPTVCADPTTPGDRKFEDRLATDNLVKPARAPAPWGRIELLRPCAQGAVLILVFRRPAGSETASTLLIWASLGEIRKVGVIEPGKLEANVYFRLQPAEAGESWPLTLTSHHPFIWSASADRGFDTVFLPAYSLVK
jgi:hypothetical protein